MCNQLQWDLYAIFATGDAFSSDQKREASQNVFDGFTAAMAKILPVFLGDVDLADLASKCAEKAGARHSAADKTRIAAVADAHAKIGKSLAAAQKAHSAMGDTLGELGDAPADAGDPEDGDKPATGKGAATSTLTINVAAGADAAGIAAAVEKALRDQGAAGVTQTISNASQSVAESALVEWKAGPMAESGLPENFAEYAELREKAKKKDDEPPKPYGDVEYADPKNGKYPIDTEEHAKAAWDYINKEKNAAEYDADGLAEVKSRIKAACKKFGIEISDDGNSGKAGEVEMTQEQIAEMVTKAAGEAAVKAAEAVKAELQPEIEKANQRATDAEARATKAESDKATAEGKVVDKARQSSGAAAEEQTSPEDARKARSERMAGTIKAALGANPIPTVI